MAHKNGCNSYMVKGPVGKNSTRMNPTDFARNNMSKGGVNHPKHLVKSNQTSAGSAKRK
jgi:hypothetical protein